MTISKNISFQMLHGMKRIRLVEEGIAERYPQGKMRCPMHLSIGQEAAAIGVGLALQHSDLAVSSHRAHAHYLSKGGDLKAMLAEIYGKATGCSSGRGGSMHLIDTKIGFMGSTAIVGNSMPVGVGLALSLQLRKSSALSAVFCGDDKGYLGDLKEYTKNLNLDNKVLFLNFVSNEQISFLYKNCFALTMPTFSGPTNIPPWEAFYHKKPVFYSSIFDIDKEYKDSVFYIDPLDENTLINGLEELYNNNSLYNIYCQKGDVMIKKNLFEKQVGDLIIEIKNLRKIRNSWKFYYDI